ncbi:MAG: DUF192 domain-containing protein, partial [Candidatus Aenigmatarchaeota archaeon]
ESRAKGLMFRESLGDDEGMLFVFEKEGHWSFWMKNTIIPLDIIWLCENLTIVHIQTAPPCREDNCPSYRTPVPASYVLEVNAGFSDKNGISAGDTATFEYK